MNLQYKYAYEKFSDAISTMAQSREPIPKRLQAVMSYAFIALKPEQVPPDVRERYTAFCETMTAKDPEPGDDGRIAATVRTMNWRTADKLAASLVEMFFDVCRAYYVPASGDGEAE